MRIDDEIIWYGVWTKLIDTDILYTHHDMSLEGLLIWSVSCLEPCIAINCKDFFLFLRERNLCIEFYFLCNTFLRSKWESSKSTVYLPIKPANVFLIFFCSDDCFPSLLLLFKHLYYGSHVLRILTDDFYHVHVCTCTLYY